MAIKKLTNTSAIPGSILTTGNVTTGTINSCGSYTTTANGYYWGTTTGQIPGQVLTTGGTNNTISWSDGTLMHSDIVEYVDIFYQFMGIDMDYERFSKMTKEEKKGLIRDLKLQKLIEDK